MPAAKKKKATVPSGDDEPATPRAARKAPASTRKPATRAKVEKAASPRATAAKKPTITTVSAQLTALTEQVAALHELVRSLRNEQPSAPTAPTPDAAPSAPSGSKLDPATFEPDLLGILRDLDRRNRHGGMVPIPEVRDVYVGSGWSRRDFDSRLLQAERDFVIDLKTANDPSRLAQPDLAIVEEGRGHLQYVVLR